MKDFEYRAPRSLEEALTLLAGQKGEVKVLAGGTDLVVQMKYGRACPAVIIDVKKIPELNRLEWSKDGGLFIGAAVPLSRIVGYTPIAEKFTILREACSLIGSFQLRSRATVGGNICNAASSADSAPPLLCLEARAIVAGPGTTRTLPLADFFAGPGKTTLSPEELLVGFEIPSPPVRSSGSYLRHIPRQDMDIAVACAASFLILSPESGLCGEARIALGAVAPTPIRAPRAESILVGTALTSDVLEEAAVCAAEAACPISDTRGSADYRRELVKVLTRRTLTKALNTIGRTGPNGVE
jgi:CO/xanthine dehydrogenase FAD-binding subunit